MKKVVKILAVLVALFASYGVSHAVTIDSFSYNACITEAGKTPITVHATDPAGGYLTYDWEVLNGPAGSIVGSGPNVIFDPPNTGPHPGAYRIKVKATSATTGLWAEAFLEICVKLGGDIDGDGLVNANDLLQVRNHFGETGTPGWIAADVNSDGVVNSLDLLQVRNGFGRKETHSDSYFFDDFECGLAKWSVSGADWGVTSSAFHNGKYSFTDSPGGDYPPNANSIATTKYSIDLISATHPILSFWQKYYIASGDSVYVDVSADGGLTWANVYSIGSDQYQSTWTQAMIDLSAYKGKSIKLRFRLREVDSSYGRISDGWYIDNVEVKEWTTGPSLGYPFSDNFESGLGNWATSGLDWSLVSSTGFGGQYAITDSPGGNYPANANSTITTAGSIDLVAATRPILSFWQKYYIASGDSVYVDVSADGGLTWANVYSIGSDQYQSTWTQAMIDLSAYKGKSIKLRFRLREVDSSYGRISDGWYIDNVEVKEWTTGPSLGYPFSDNFESGLGNWATSGLDWSLVSSTGFGGQYAITDSPGDNYPANANSTITTAGSIDLVAATRPILSFWQKYYIASGDSVYVDVSADGGLTWANVYSIGSDQYQSTWTQAMIDLSAYKGKSIKLRFRLREVDSSYGRISDGWYIDNVEVKEWTTGPSLGYPFSDNFESGLGNWATSGLDWSLVSSTGFGGQYAITDSPGGNYPANANSTITTAGSIDLVAATRPILSFWQKYYIASGDSVYVDVSADGGLTWTQVYTIGSNQYQSTWTQAMIDLSAYKGKSIKLRFRLREVDSSYNRISDGWYIDNVEVNELL